MHAIRTKHFAVKEAKVRQVVDWLLEQSCWFQLDPAPFNVAIIDVKTEFAPVFARYLESVQ